MEGLAEQVVSRRVSTEEGKIHENDPLFLVCANTDRPMPCRHKGQGHEIKRARTWLRGAIDLSTLTLNVVCAAFGGIAIASLPGTIVGALAEQVIETGVNILVSELENPPETMCDNGIVVGDQQQVYCCG